MRIGNNTKSKFKGVLKHANGHWGTQIYVNHDRIWLGTHKTEIEAAMAYDSASIRFKPGDNQRNFPWSSVTKHEPMFQKDYSSEEIVDMLKHGTYTSKFFDFLRTQNEGQDLGPSSNQDYSGFSCKLLFQKELTPSDVSKLNRLVVPKKYAIKYFPRIVNAKEDNKEVERPEDVHVVFKDMTTSANASEINKKVDKMNEVNLVFKDRTHIANSNEDNREMEKTDEVHLVFKDRMNREWKFRYCYWQSSQSYVFTRGWNRFVKENKLNANDTIAFYACESRKRKTGKEKESFWLIDIGFPSETRDVRVMEEIGENVDPQVDLRLRLGRTVVKEEEEKLVEDQVLTKFEATAPAKPARRVILFGSQIN